MSAADRAEARRKAILSRGTDRLAKLTTSARGEDHPAYVDDGMLPLFVCLSLDLTLLVDPPTRRTARTDAFVGEETVMPTPPVRGSPAPSNQRTDGPTAWSQEQQQEFIRALMAENLTGAPPAGMGPQRGMPALGSNAPAPGGGEDPMAAMMSALSQFSGQPGTNTEMLSGQTMQAIRPRTMLQKLMPLIHLVATWALLGYFVLFKEPQAYELRTHTAENYNAWQRWADLGWRNAKDGFGVQAMVSKRTLD